MTVLAYAGLLALCLAVAGVWDELWLRYLRPLMSEQYGWPDVQPDEHIPAVAWVGALVVVSIVFILLPTVGVSAGY